MRHFASQRFWACYGQLPESVRLLADKNFAILKSNPRHPSLQFKKVGPYWSARVGKTYRALAAQATDGNMVWSWIGTHAEYEKLLRGG